MDEVGKHQIQSCLTKDFGLPYTRNNLFEKNMDKICKKGYIQSKAINVLSVIFSFWLIDPDINLCAPNKEIIDKCLVYDSK